ncbi:nucleotide exchange factor GrpE [Halorussus salilacus]|uniref:nucleotide exchange factor GrpE n=1 Tax=Halorussus salilacus TaxID=2953750 RepID=UPI00209EB936|nr:nucleotide exchange factor GrpE [Halorussus salilacus]USZ68971.1 nucleotide exchange factor GrpE [Halorussus salilacus]
MTEEEVTEQVREDAEDEVADAERADAEDAAESAESDATDSDAGDEVADALGPKSTSLVAKVALEDESLAADLEAHLADLETAREEAEQRAEDLESKLKRNRADFQNYKKRAKKRQEQMEARATEDLVERLLDVRDNLVRALDADHDDVESIREGVEMTRKELDRVFDEEDVSPIDPEPGAETDPQRHEVMMQVESDQPEGTVADVYQPGYEMGDRVLRAAQVTVSEGDE